APLFTGVEQEASFRVPAFRADPDGEGPQVAPPVESLLVLLGGQDHRGAAAKPEQELIIPVENAPPTIALRMASDFGAVVGTQIKVYAKYAAPDDMPQNVNLTWTLYSPSMQPVPLVDVGVPPDGDVLHLQQGKGFTPQVEGNWDLEVVATDRLGKDKKEDL